MNKFIISGLIVISLAAGTVFFKAKKINNNELLLTPLSSIKPQSSMAVPKKDVLIAKEPLKVLSQKAPPIQTSSKKTNPVPAVSVQKQVAEKSALPAKKPVIVRSAPAVLKPAVLTTDKKKVLPIPAPPKIIANNTSIQTVQRELQSVIDLNQKINMVQTKKSAQLLRIQDQIMIQQRILNDIQRSVRTPKTGQPSRDALLAQEKLRIIHEESLQNKKTLEDQSQPKKRP